MTSTAAISYLDRLPPEHFDAAAKLYDTAFGAKFSHAIPTQADRVALVRDALVSEFGITAFDRDRLVGLAGYHTPEGSLTSGMTGRAILERLGLWRGLRAALILSLYERKPESGELVMDGIAVHSDYRGRGIGTGLLERVVAYAAAHDYNSVRLDVIDRNPGARKLYERFGFETTGEERYPYLERVLGFSGSATMVYNVAPNTARRAQCL